jgi:hypothetical protein
MTRRAIHLIALAGFLFNGTVRADDTPNLTGSTLKADDVISQSDAVFIGEVTQIGSTASSPVMASYGGTKVNVAQTYKGSVDRKISVTIDALDLDHEQAPLAGNKYVFFVRKNTETGSDAFTVLKLLPATKDNIITAMLAVLKERTKAKLLEIEKEKKQSPMPSSH